MSIKKINQKPTKKFHFLIQLKFNKTCKTKKKVKNKKSQKYKTQDNKMTKKIPNDINSSNIGQLTIDVSAVDDVAAIPCTAVVVVVDGMFIV